MNLFIYRYLLRKVIALKSVMQTYSKPLVVSLEVKYLNDRRVSGEFLVPIIMRKYDFCKEKVSRRSGENRYEQKRLRVTEGRRIGSQPHSIVDPKGAYPRTPTCL